MYSHVHVLIKSDTVAQDYCGKSGYIHVRADRNLFSMLNRDVATATGHEQHDNHSVFSLTESGSPGRRYPHTQYLHQQRCSTPTTTTGRYTRDGMHVLGFV